MTHEHSAPDYCGRCESCCVRLESPSRWMLDEAKRTGGSIVTLTKTYRILPEHIAMLTSKSPPPPNAQ